MRDPVPGFASVQWSPEALGRGVSVSSPSGDQKKLMLEVDVKLYSRRWLMLLIFCGLSASNGFMYLQYSIISNIFMRFYDVDALAIDWLAMSYLLTYIPGILPVLWLLKTRGIREVIVIGAAFNCIGAWIKVGSADPDLFYLTFLGQFVCSVADVFVLGIPSYLASVWFGEEEVTTACSIGVLGYQVCVTSDVASCWDRLRRQIGPSDSCLTVCRAGVEKQHRATNLITSS